MDIHFISSLTPDDEDRLASTLLEAITPLLRMMPIAYTVRIRTASNRVFQHTRTDLPEVEDLDAAAPQDGSLSS